MTSSENRAAPQPHGSINPLTQRVWVAALGRFGTPSLANPWNAYHGDYSDEDLVAFGLEVRQRWLDQDNQYLLPHALAFLAKSCKDQRVRDLWQRIHGLLPGGGRLREEPLAEA